MQSTLTVVGVLVVMGAVGCGAAVRGPARDSAAPAGGAVVATVRLPDFGNDVATGADGRAYVSVSSGRLVIVDTAAASVAAEVRVEGEPYAVAVTPDSRRAYVVDLQGAELAVVDTARAQQKLTIPMGTLERPTQRPSAVASADGSRVYVANTAKDHLFAIDTVADQVANDLFLDFHPSDVAVRADGRYLVTVGCRLSCVDGTLLIVDTTSFKPVARMELAFVPTGLVVTPDGARAYVANGREASVSAVDLKAQTVVSTIAVGPEPVGIAMNAAGSVVYVTSFRDGTLSAISTGRDRVVATGRVGASPRAVVVSRDDTRAFVTHSTSTLTIVDLAALGR